MPPTDLFFAAALKKEAKNPPPSSNATTLIGLPVGHTIPMLFRRLNAQLPQHRVSCFPKYLTHTVLLPAFFSVLFPPPAYPQFRHMEILLSRALQQMQYVNTKGHPVPFDITFVTCNRSENRGGEIVTLKGVTLTKKQKFLPPEVRNDDQPKPQTHRSADGKSHDFFRRRRKLYNPLTQQVLTVYPRLILEFNGQKIRWHAD